MPVLPITIRDFAKKDIDEVIECAKESFVEELEIEGFDPEGWRKLVKRRFSLFGKTLFVFFRLLNREPFKFFVADVDGKAVGTTVVTKLRNIGYIQLVMMHPHFRRKGIAYELMRTAIEFIQRRGFAKAILHVSATNDAAKNLYNKLGFKKFEDIVYLTADVDFITGFESSRGVQIREFAKSDTDTVYDIIRRSREPNAFNVYNIQKSDLRSSLWERIISMSKSKRTVAIKDANIVGYSSSSWTSTMEAGRIRNIDVMPGTASQEIEEILVKEGVDFIKSSGTKTVLITLPQAREVLIRRLENLGFRKRFFTEGMVLEQFAGAAEV